MPSANSPAFNVPVVDIAHYISNPSSLEAQKVVDQVREACTTSGFFALVGHGIPERLQDAVFKGAEKFFALPFEEKNKIDKKFSLGASNRGYEVLGGQALEAGKMPDLKEGFYAGQDIPADDPRTIAGRFYMGPNVWPPTSLIPESEFKEPVTEYYTKMHALSLLVLEILARGLPYGPNVFDEFVSNDAVAAIRILHYPPQTSEDKNQLGAGAHTDFGAITLLLQDGTPGLQVWNHVDEEWLSVPPTRGAYVVNIGDMLSKWTSGLYKSNLHRVLNKSSKDRYSIPFFFDGNLDCPLAPFDGSAVEGEVLTVEGHMNERFATTFGRGKEGAKH